MAQKTGQTVATSPESEDGPFRGHVNYACMETELYSLPVSTRERRDGKQGREEEVAPL